MFRDISDDYRISYKTAIGKGHYGMVRDCQHLRNGDDEVLAVKSIDKRKISRLDHIKREVYFLHQMEHDNIIKMVDCYEDANSVHIISDKYTGGELFDMISDSTTPYGCFSERKAANITKSLLEAIAYLHDNGIVHRDIKPENILFETEEEDSDIKLIDFGLARRHEKGDSPMSNPVGTAYYMSPELLKGKYDRACDVWSVGTIAYILLCGYPPFNGHNDPDIFKAIKKGHFDFPMPAWANKSELAKDFIKCLLMKDTKNRFTAKEALGHPWIRNNVPLVSPTGNNTFCVEVISDDEDSVTDDADKDDIKKRVDMLRKSIQRLKAKAR